MNFYIDFKLNILICRDRIVTVASFSVYLVIGVISIIGNLITLIIVLKFKLYKHSQYIYKSSIAVSDALQGFMMIYYLIEHVRSKFVVKIESI